MPIEITLNHYCATEVKADKVLNVVDSKTCYLDDSATQDMIQAALMLLDARHYGLDLAPYLYNLQRVAEEYDLVQLDEED